MLFEMKFVILELNVFPKGFLHAPTIYDKILPKNLKAMRFEIRFKYFIFTLK